jgi:hypothetical protein
MAESDFSSPFIIGYGSSPSRCPRDSLKLRIQKIESARTCPECVQQFSNLDVGRGAGREGDPPNEPADMPTIAASAIKNARNLRIVSLHDVRPGKTRRG